jgi:hypothetical protein
MIQAYKITVLITTVKGFIAQTPGACIIKTLRINNARTP